MIPKVIVQFWNTPDIPDDVAELMDTWKQHNPDFRHLVFDYEQAASFIEVKYGKKIRDLFLSAALPAMQSDIFRVAYCLAKGGFYIDAGTRCKAELEPNLPENGELLLMRKWHGGIWNGMIGAQAGQADLKLIWDKIIHNLKVRETEDVWQVTGPKSFNQVVNHQTEASKLLIIEQKEIRFFDIVNDLKYKSNHWSKVQKTQSIFN
ncbi:MAG: glycosyltransferase [Pseudomonadota bacterium]|nr:glycosyltransferase [Pseudomonadota bacterium]MEC9262237.1 glycosyltransferase [Pseudomonadota bacterium]|tara:strand:+ start:97 stop:714 length:618 start_codon:yes stop_codon:yes gene_type:complete